MKTIIFSLICLCHITLVVFGSPVKKAGANYEKIIEELKAESFELNGSDEIPVISINLETLESGSQEIPLDFLAESTSNESDDDDDDDDDDDNDASVELKNSGECPQTTVFPEPESDSDENGTCPMTFPTSTSEDPIIKKEVELALVDVDIEDDEEPKIELKDEILLVKKEDDPAIEIEKEVVVVDKEEVSDEEEETQQEVPKITITKIDKSYDSSSSSSSSEEADMVIMPFLEVDDFVVLKELDVPFIDDMDMNVAKGDSNEITFNLIDSNDLVKHEEDAHRPKKKLEDSFIQKQFSRFLDSIMGIFEF